MYLTTTPRFTKRPLCFRFLQYKHIGFYVFLRSGHFILDCVTRITIVRSKVYQTDFYAIFYLSFITSFLGPNIFLQCPILEQSHLCSSTYTMRRNFPPRKRGSQNYVLVYCKITGVKSYKQNNGILCCDGMRCGRYVPKFRSNLVPPSSWQNASYLKVEETILSVTVLAVNQNTKNHILEDNKLNIHYTKNLKSHVICYTACGR